MGLSGRIYLLAFPANMRVCICHIRTWYTGWFRRNLQYFGKW